MINMQHHTQQINDRKSGLFSYLLLLTIFFIFVEFSILIQSSEFYFGDYKLIAGHIKIPGIVIPGVLYFILIQVALHFFYTVIVWVVARLMGAALQCSWRMTNQMAFGLWVIGIVTILLANQYMYPNSKFAALIHFLPSAVTFYVLIFCGVLIGTALLIAMIGFIRVMPVAATSTMGLGLAFSIGIHSFHTPLLKEIATATQPNIILIGIDSLRPDFIGYFGYEKITPHLDAFLDQSTVFSDAITPLARTFPAWVSLLSGQYPKQTGVRFNLPSSLHFNLQNTLPAILHKQGYETIFATDETRFSNIDQRFGFDKVLTPPIGFNDFLLGSLNDFPMANLIVNTTLGRYLLPHSYGNRPAYITYDPNSFITFLKPFLAEPRTKPLFFAVHLCLPHYPYVWSNNAADEDSVRNYRASVQRVDQQFNALFDVLQQNNLLQHSIVVVLSDHGEAIELPGDRITEPDLFISGNDNKSRVIPHFYPANKETEAVNVSVGHGTDVLGLTQYHVLLAFRTFGLEKNQRTVLTPLVSLLDIKPTILDFLHYPHSPLDNGRSQKNIILGKKPVHLSSDLFIESDFSPQAIRTVHPETIHLLIQGISFFQVDSKTGRIAVKDNMEKVIISSKQYAYIHNGWILALYPQSLTKMMPILVNLNTGQWTNDLRIPFAKAAQADRMLQALQGFFQQDMMTVMNTPRINKIAVNKSYS